MFNLMKMKEFPKLESKLILAPMAAVNCAAFRYICKKSGAGMISTPMIHVKGLVESSESIIKRTCFLKEEKPISVQLVGSDSNAAKEATKIIEDYADVIDINLGCPDKDILKDKSGSFFIKHPEQIKKIVEPIINNTNKPVTAKIRIGWDEKSINTTQVVKILEDLGICAIAIHARTTKQGYSGTADLNEIKKAKEISNIPIIGNGDIDKPGKAKAMFEKTKCDYAMIGRGAIGNPLIFKTSKYLINNQINMPEPSEEDKMNVFKEFLEFYDKFENNRSFSELRQQSMWFTKGLTGAKILRLKLMAAKNVEDILDIYNIKK